MPGRQLDLEILLQSRGMVSIDRERLVGIQEVGRLNGEKLHRLIKAGKVVILGRDEKKRIAVGKGMTTKVNVNLGTSSVMCNEAGELEKARIAEIHGADTISDCSMTGDIDSLRACLLHEISIPLTTIPVYQAVADAGSIEKVDDRCILRTIQKHVDDGVDSIVIHAGFDRQALEDLREQRRIMGIVSKGGSLSAAISLYQDAENPFIRLLDDILEILAGTGVVLNLGNAMRSGSIHDFKDAPQHNEIVSNAKIATRANAKGVPVIIEGLGGHVNAYHLKEWLEDHDRITGNRPLFVSGPIPTEIGVGHDHISAAIGGAMAAGYGADYLCAITPAEHLALPDKNHIKEGVIAAKIAAHVGDSIKHGINAFFEPDKILSKHRASRAWDKQFAQALDPEGARELHPPGNKDCSMCGKFCAIALMEKYLFSKKD
ncbi:phosphomethylpyrimidine synthase ThiC [Candidatus Bathyarchaeota archaeon]|nr:phosphomethylpyrimidine synthase ThiC [Candidatus Bathyarchaeota archaeon]